MTFFKDESGQSIVEYALILGLIAIAAVAVIILLSPKISGMFGKTNEGAANAENQM